MNKKVIIIAIIIGVVVLGGVLLVGTLIPAFFLVDGTWRLDEKRDPIEVTVEGYEMAFTLPKDYYESSSDAFDAYYTDSDSNFCVYGYRKENIDEGQTLEEFFNQQNTTILSAREDVTELGGIDTSVTDTLSIMKRVYAASKDGNRNYYCCYLVEFLEKPDVYAWVMVNAAPSYARAKENLFDEIVATAKLLPETTMTLNQEITVPSYGMSFMIGKKYVSADHDTFDAYYTNDTSRIGIYAYDSDDIATDTNREEFFREKNIEFAEIQQSYSKVQDLDKQELDQLDIMKEVYSVMVDGEEMYYTFYMVEFDEAPDKFAYVVFYAEPEYAKTNAANFGKIAASGKLVSDDTLGIE